MTKIAAKPDIDFSTLSFEQSLAELETIVRALESGKSGLEESIQLYERGVALRQHCESKLKDAQLRVEKLTLSADGKTKTEPFKTSRE
jgi:exodeoxyribonuclease VII small subunit